MSANANDTQSLDQRRAAYAWGCVKDGVGKDYVSLVSGASALIMSNGLLQALAYYENKGKEAKTIGGHIQSWILGGSRVDCSKVAFDKAVSEMSGADSTQYITYTEEALAMLRWLRQLAKAAQKGG